MQIDTFSKQLSASMQKAVEHTLHQFSTLHTGKANPQMVESVHVDVYGSAMRLKDIAAISTPDARTISVQPWDKSNLKAIEKAINAANLGINAAVFGDSVRCPIPELSRERRIELTKVASTMAEDGRVSIRSCRRDAMEAVKKAQKGSTISEDEAKLFEKEVQKLTDKFIKEIDQHLKAKEKELTSV